MRRSDHVGVGHGRVRAGSVFAGAVVAIAAIGITTAAIAFEGNPTAQLDLHDGSVWITKADEQLVGHFNNESRRLDGQLKAPSAEFDLLQERDQVLVHNGGGEPTLIPLDTAGVALGDATDLPVGAVVEMGGGTVAILDPASGALHALPFTGVASFSAVEAEPLAELGEDAAMTVAADGTVYAVSPKQGTLLTITVGGDGTAERTAEQPLEGLEKGSAVEVTSVGDVPVVLDRERELLVMEGREVPVVGAEVARLAADVAQGDTVTLAVEDALLTLPLGGGEAAETRTGSSGGRPAQPVVVEGCAYGAWSGTGRVVRDCVGTEADLVDSIAQYDGKGELRFRVNRDVVILNDVVTGGAWLPSDALQKVDNWDDLVAPEGEGEESEETTTSTVPDPLPPDRGPDNKPPVANDDDLGARAGQTVILPVLLNDTDPDGDVLTVTLPDGPPSLGDVQPIQNGQALQISVRPDASGTESFRYEADDGRGGTDVATVSLTVRTDDQNGAPEQLQKMQVPLEQGGEVTYNVLPEWRDPDGDPIFLMAVHAAPGDEVSFTPDGRVTYRAVAGTLGPLDVPIEVSDGTTSIAGVLALDIRQPGSNPPVTTADHVVTRAGVQVEVAPLVNDLGAGSEPLRLARVDQVVGTEIEADFANRTFTFSSTKVDTYYVQYLASNGVTAVPGIVRIDVLEPTDADRAPVAVRDIAMLTRGGEVLVDVLANDSDPSGGVLVVQSIDVPTTTGLSVSVLGHETLRITDRAAATDRVTIRYQMSNGQHSAQGEVIVILVPAPEKLRPPHASDDTAVVRAGDVVTVPVLDNDSHPNDDEMHVVPELVTPADTALGESFVSQDTVRFRSTGGEGQATIVYEVVDSVGQKQAASVTIQILPVDVENNAPPRPLDLEARAVAGSPATIVVPLDGIDPDGDSVEFAGFATGQTKGSVAPVRPGVFTYTPSETSTGVDTFTYRVRDALGKEATATIRVGIAPGADVNQAPFAVRDDVATRPGRVVSVPVLDNDSDPEGDRPALVDDGLIVPDDVPGFDAEVADGSRIDVTAPEEEGQYALQYTIADSLGAEAQGVVQITVDDEVPLVPPIARDDYVPSEEIVDGVYADVDLLSNDEDPDGRAADLSLAVDGDVQADAQGVLRVEIGEKRQLIGYTVTDEDDGVARAFVHVPGIEDLRPTLISTDAVEVRSGETIELPLDEHVRATDGRDLMLTDPDLIQAQHADGSPLFIDEHTLVYTSVDDYVGSDAISFEVTDGSSIDDPAGRKSTLSIPLTVLPPANAAPTFVNARMSVGAGDPEAATLALGPLATDPNPEDTLTFAIESAPEGITAAVEGDTLRVTADPSLRGSAGAVQVRVSDGEADAVIGEVEITVTASTQPLATVSDDAVPEAVQGRAVDVPVLANDQSPFPGEPLSLDIVTLESTGAGTAEVVGDQVRVTPKSDFVGRMTVRYRVLDATGDAERAVEGRIVLTVRGAPDAPGRPTVSGVQDRQVTLSWSAPADNGEPITEYLVTGTGGSGYQRSCTSTRCDLPGLTNNVEYTFTVVAVNEVGPSEPSLVSEVARPDVRPNTPAMPTVTDFGNGELTVQWTEPKTAGSPVSGYMLEVNPALPNGTSVIDVPEAGSKTPSRVVKGLLNGVTYEFRVQARNAAPDPSDWSGWSKPGGVPATVPDAPTALQMSSGSGANGDATVSVQWTPPAFNGGDAIAGYEIRALLNGSVTKTNTALAGARSTTFALPASGTDYEFQVRAQNKAGWSEPGVGRARAFTKPGAPSGVTTAAGDRSITVRWNDAALNGASASWVQYQFNVGSGWSSGWASGGASGSGVIAGLTAKQTYSVAVRAVVHPNGDPSQTLAGDKASGPDATPWGPPIAPSVSASTPNTSNANWSVNATSSGNGRSVTRVIVKVGGRTVYDGANLTPSGSSGYNSGDTVTAQVVVQGGEASPWGSSGTLLKPWAPPGAPRIIRTEEGDRKVGIEWRDDRTGTDPDGHLTWQFSINGGGWTTDGVQPGQVGVRLWAITGLQNGTTYRIRMRAVEHTSDGRLLYSDPSETMTLTPYPCGCSF